MTPEQEDALLSGLSDYLDDDDVPGTPIAAEVTICDTESQNQMDTSTNEVAGATGGTEDPKEDPIVEKPKYVSPSGRKYPRKV